MNQLRLFGVYFRINVLGEVAYRVNFYVQLFQSLVELATALAGLAVVFTYTGDLRGWTPDEMLALVGVYFMAGARSAWSSSRAWSNSSRRCGMAALTSR